MSSTPQSVLPFPQRAELFRAAVLAACTQYACHLVPWTEEYDRDYGMDIRPLLRESDLYEIRHARVAP